MVKAEREAMQRVGDFVTVGGKLREIDTHGRSLDSDAAIATLWAREKIA
jgi:hypothetical protein